MKTKSIKMLHTKARNNWQSLWFALCFLKDYRLGRAGYKQLIRKPKETAKSIRVIGKELLKLANQIEKLP